MAKKKKVAKKKATKKKARRKVSPKNQAASGANNKGRPSLFTQERREKIYENLHKCPFIKPAALNALVAESTVHAWIKRGAEDIELGLKTDFSLFYERVTQLVTQAEIDLFTVVKDESKKNWIASRYILQCLNGKRYGSKAAVRVEEAEKGDSAFENENIHAQLVQVINRAEED